ncbi:MAG: hypothetical protein UV00_C0019G0037 [candidate division WWE3 bacterium GW2011_GWF1_42_14]|uniref:Uncharacterized protein n=2 Tax=Katanobacteria TaxID=422282 RepID=A0A0G1AS68_UNCKA|nr:MAG: hypothetical protein UU92_C0019G0004 [candidate division WWE3 bacterium GW2011_GWA1_42_12]KKS36936.1 MAG: hypothetical protein UV00_C0019G0037 [candidate division WWE3 bacterium GW2011_GWF1_42_14]KKS39903.1 MAG: hypothetical protein UV03_C0017G0011 [candidate division WWE3 bacterium GW2011_GWE1_42_16]KKS65962.1 MAG: hypothetical protein UV35_C0028G0011 [candidate division WWE3 bacterium GW2011_GWB1_42_6]
MDILVAVVIGVFLIIFGLLAIAGFFTNSKESVR